LFMLSTTNTDSLGANIGGRVGKGLSVSVCKYVSVLSVSVSILSVIDIDIRKKEIEAN